MTELATELNNFSDQCYFDAKERGFWDKEFIEGGDGDTKFVIENPSLIAEKLALVHTEISEAMEELRLMSVDWDKFGEELADAVIRIGDIAGSKDISLGSSVVRKMEKNKHRPYKHGKTI